MGANCSVPHEITFVALLASSEEWCQAEVLTHRAGPGFCTFHYLLIYTRLSALAAWYSRGTSRVTDSQTALGREDGGEQGGTCVCVWLLLKSNVTAPGYCEEIA